MNKVKFIIFLLISVLCNPFYQMVSFLICSDLGLDTDSQTSVSQVNVLAFIFFLVLVFLMRLLIYGLVFKSTLNLFKYQNRNDFLYVFCEQHLYQCIGVLLFLIWASPLEGNIIGFFVVPLTLLFGTILSVITFIRILNTKSIVMERTKKDILF